MNEQTFYQLFLNLRYFLELDQIYSFSPISGTQKKGASNVASVYGLSIPAMIVHSCHDCPFGVPQRLFSTEHYFVNMCMSRHMNNIHVPFQDLDFYHHISWSLFFVLNEFRLEVVVCFVDIAGIVNYQCLDYNFIIYIRMLWTLGIYASNIYQMLKNRFIIIVL